MIALSPIDRAIEGDREDGSVGFEAAGVGVGDVVSDHVLCVLPRDHPFGGDMNASYHSQVRLSARGALRVRLGFERYSFEPWTIPMATNGIVHDTIPAEWYNLGTKTVPFEGIGIVGYTILKRGTQGEYRYVGQGEARYRAFLPLPLPPNPPLRIDAKLLELLGDADRSLGRLDIISDLIPNPKMYLRQMVFKEALLSSQIEGTQSTFSDVLMFETSLGRPPNDDVKEVSNYIEAQTEGIRRIKEGDPITLRLLNDLHAILRKILICKKFNNQKLCGSFLIIKLEFRLLDKLLKTSFSKEH